MLVFPCGIMMQRGRGAHEVEKPSAHTATQLFVKIWIVLCPVAMVSDGIQRFSSHTMLHSDFPQCANAFSTEIDIERIGPKKNQVSEP